MVITKTPFRMSFFGGGTDYQPFFEENGGSVISTTFDKYAYVSVRHLPRFFEHHNQIAYSKIEKVIEVDEIEHPLVRNAMKCLDMHDLHISYDADLPARSGLGSSSSFAVGLLNAFHALKGQYAGDQQLAQEAIHVERVLCGESGGWQDQIATAYGGLNRIDFRGNEFKVKPIIISKERKHQLEENLMLFFTGFSRFSSDIASAQIKATKDKQAELLEILKLVDVGERILEDRHGDIDEFGRLLHQTWQLKRGITNKISSDTLDEIYATAMKNGALGGKLLGAGGGGFFAFYVPKEQQIRVRQALSKLLYIPFAFENNGTEVMYYQPEEYEVDENRKESAEK